MSPEIIQILNNFYLDMGYLISIDREATNNFVLGLGMVCYSNRALYDQQVISFFINRTIDNIGLVMQQLEYISINYKNALTIQNKNELLVQTYNKCIEVRHNLNLTRNNRNQLLTDFAYLNHKLFLVNLDDTIKDIRYGIEMNTFQQNYLLASLDLNAHLSPIRVIHYKVLHNICHGVCNI